MSGVVVTISPDGARSLKAYSQREPALETLQELVGGYIENVPHGVRFRGVVRRALVNEDGRRLGLPRNEIGSRLWRATLDDGRPLRYRPEVFGPLVLLCDDAEDPVEDPLRDAWAGFDEATTALGRLTVGAVTDYLADNFDWSLTECREKARALIEEQAREMDTEGGLVDEFAAWLNAQDIEPGSADELLLRTDLTGEQRGWLSTFVLRWDAIMAMPS